MEIEVVVHDAEEGDYWAEVPAIPGCATAHDTWEALLQNLYEAVEGCLSVTLVPIKPKDLLYSSCHAPTLPVAAGWDQR